MNGPPASWLIVAERIVAMLSNHRRRIVPASQHVYRMPSVGLPSSVTASPRRRRVALGSATACASRCSTGSQTTPLLTGSQIDMRATEILEWVRGPAVLDVGCSGHEVQLEAKSWLHGRLRTQFSDVTGIDLNEKAIEKMRAAGYEQLFVQSAETFDLHRQFDTIVAGELIEHLSNPGQFLERALAHLRPGGQIVISTPWPFSAHYIAYALAKYPRTSENPEHTMWFCPRTLEELASRAGLQIEHLQLISDYDRTSEAEFYRRSVKLLDFLRPVLPARLVNNTVLAVLRATSSC